MWAWPAMGSLADAPVLQAAATVPPLPAVLSSARLLAPSSVPPAHRDTEVSPLTVLVQSCLSDFPVTGAWRWPVSSPSWHSASKRRSLRFSSDSAGPRCERPWWPGVPFL